MNDLIIVDTREKGHKTILEYFDSVNQNYIISKLDAGDYMIYKNNKVIIDKKDGLSEICKNLCNKKEHERLVREIDRAFASGCERFIFLIQSADVKCEADIKKWKSYYTKVKGYVLYKIMMTFKEHHNVEYMFAEQKEMGKKIIDILVSE